MKYETRSTPKRVLAKFFLLGLIAVLGSPTMIYAQLASGSITGSVLDTSGAAITNASVNATNLTTATARTVVTNEFGEFVIPALQPGPYKIAAGANGFEVSTSTVTLSLGQVLNFTFQLKPGASTQTIEVNGSSSALALETQSHEIGLDLPAQTLENLPASSGKLFSALTVTPNVYPYASIGGTSDIATYAEGNNDLNIGGQAYATTTYLQDGVTNVNDFTRTANFQPAVEAVQEVSMIANGASARFDQPSVVNVITKSGSDAFHGRLYDYLRNDALDGIGYYNVPKPPLRYNQFGVNVGGPIVNKKLFFFFDYAGLRESLTNVLFVNVPTALERAGDFSQQAAGGWPTGGIIYDPATYDPVAKTISPFPNNTIPSNRVSGFAKQFLQYVPLPTPSAAPGYNYQTEKATTTTYDSYTGRMDWNLGKSDSAYGAYETTNPNNVVPSFVATPIFDTENIQSATNAYFQETHTFSSSLLNVARFGYNGSTVLTTIKGAGAQNYVQSFGIQGLDPAPAQYAPPSIQTNSFGLGNPYAPQGANQKVFQFADEINWIVGRHTIAIGIDADKTFFDGNWVLLQDGWFYFSGQYTSNHQTWPNGIDLADFILGYPTLIQGGVGTTVGNFRQWIVQPYIQDDWKISKKLTFNLGLRYDYYQSPNDTQGNTHVYDLPTNTTHNGTFLQNSLNFAPRVGLAYSLNNTTAVHAGYGVYYSPFMYAELLFVLANEPTWSSQTIQFPITAPTQVVNSLAGTPVFSPWTTALHMPTPYYQQYNLSVQKSFGSNWLASLSYLGNSAKHIHMRYNPNQATVPADPLNPSPIASRRPYPGVGDIYEAANFGHGSYNGLQAELQRKYVNGLSILTSFVWSKALDTGTADNDVPTNGLDPQSNYGLSDDNVKYAFKFNPVYDLPFGPGRRFANSNNWFNSEVIGGWQASGALSVLAGTPTVAFASDVADIGGYRASYASQVCDPNKGAPHTKLEWFNTACLVQPAPGVIGTEQRNSILGPRQTNLDSSFFKEFPFMENSKFELRADLFNTFNHPLLSMYWGQENVASGTFGQVSVSGSRTIQLSLKLRY